VAGEATISLQISCAGLTSTQFPLQDVAAAPGIFTVAQSGKGQAAIVNQDGSLTAPSPAGSYIQVYLTGMGPFGDAGADGLAHLQLPVTATIGGLAASVEYAGQAPGYVGGLQQLNLLIPANAPPGAAVPLSVTVGGATTQAGVTLAIGGPLGSN
jgi:uncharacterized protein (TIGR03437 family)